MKTIKEAIAAGNATIIDVRTPAEFEGGNVAGSINIPLNELPNQIEEIKEKKNIIFCCASGIRSHQATMLLRQYGVDCVDGGSWLDVNYHCNN